MRFRCLGILYSEGRKFTNDFLFVAFAGDDHLVFQCWFGQALLRSPCCHGALSTTCAISRPCSSVFCKHVAIMVGWRTGSVRRCRGLAAGKNKSTNNVQRQLTTLLGCDQGRSSRRGDNSVDKVAKRPVETKFTSRKNTIRIGVRRLGDS